MIAATAFDNVMLYILTDLHNGETCSIIYNLEDERDVYQNFISFCLMCVWICLNLENLAKVNEIGIGSNENFTLKNENLLASNFFFFFFRTIQRDSNSNLLYKAS